LNVNGPITAREVRDILKSAPGVKIVDDVEKNYFPMPKDASGQDDILVGRIRQDLSDPSGKVHRPVRRGGPTFKGAPSTAFKLPKSCPKRACAHRIKKLVVNADDFGRSSLINRGIIEAHQKGIVTSASLMTHREGSGSPSVARQNPKLGSVCI